MSISNLRMNLSAVTFLLLLIYAPVTLSDQISNTSTVTAQVCPPHSSCFNGHNLSTADAILVRPPDIVISLSNGATVSADKQKSSSATATSWVVKKARVPGVSVPVFSTPVLIALLLTIMGIMGYALRKNRNLA